MKYYQASRAAGLPRPAGSRSGRRRLAARLPAVDAQRSMGHAASPENPFAISIPMPHFAPSIAHFASAKEGPMQCCAPTPCAAPARRPSSRSFSRRTPLRVQATAETTSGMPKPKWAGAGGTRKAAARRRRSPPPPASNSVTPHAVILMPRRLTPALLPQETT